MVNHDRFGWQSVSSAETRCRIARDGLVCDRGFHADGYSVWIVPEPLAEEAGMDRLMDALTEGVIASRADHLRRADKASWGRERR